MVCVRVLVVTSFLLLFGCSDGPESTIDDLAEKGKDLVQSTRELSEDAAERMGEELGAAREKASEKLYDSVEALSEQ